MAARPPWNGRAAGFWRGFQVPLATPMTGITMAVSSILISSPPSLLSPTFWNRKFDEY
jgi:hypothetical protein